MNGMKTQRYNTATRIRHNCASILGASETDLLKPDIRKEKFREEIGWVNEAGLYSSIDVPILHKNWYGEYSLPSIFLNPKLMGVSLSYSLSTLWETDSLFRYMSPSFVGPWLEGILWMVNHFIRKPRQWLRFTKSATSPLEPLLHVVYWYVIASFIEVSAFITLTCRLDGRFRVTILFRQ